MHDAVRNKYDLVMSSGKEGGPYQNPLFRLRDLPGLRRVVLVTSRCTAIATFSAPSFPPANLSDVFVSDGNVLLLIERDFTGLDVKLLQPFAHCADECKGTTWTHVRNKTVITSSSPYSSISGS